jgi:outer membrane protein insertion porin family
MSVIKIVAAVIVCALLGTVCFAQQFRLGRLEITGVRVTKEAVIRRMIPLTEGDVFNTVLWELGVAEINRSGLFEPVTENDVVRRFDPALGIVDVELRLTERDRQRIDVSAGGGTTGGASLGLDYTNINLRGRADRFAARLLIGNREQSAAVSYSLTTLSSVPVRFDLSGSYQRLEFVDATVRDGEQQPLFIERTGGASLAASFPIGKLRHTLWAPTRAGLSYSFASTNLIDSLGAGAAAGEITQSNIRVASVTPFLTRDTLDRAFDPTSGTQLVIAAELSARALGGSLNTVRPSLDYRRFFRVGRRDREPRVVGVRVRLAHIAGFGEPFRPRALSSAGGVPLFRRFFLGGESQVRGYDVNSISPLARVERFVVTEGSEPVLLSSDTRPIGGDTQLILNAEYRVPLFWRLSAAAFADLGASVNARRLGEERIETNTQVLDVPATLVTVLGPLAPGESRFASYRVSVGGELRFTLPVLNLPLRLIFAANPNARTRPPGSTLIAPEERFAFRFGFSRTL